MNLRWRCAVKAAQRSPPARRPAKPTRKRRGTMLKLHYHPFSTYSRRVRIALLEKQIPCELVTIDMGAGKHREPAYRAINPYGRVPTLEEDGFVLYESTAILDYLESTHPTPPL